MVQGEAPSLIHSPAYLLCYAPTLASSEEFSATVVEKAEKSSGVKPIAPVRSSRRHRVARHYPLGIMYG